MYSAEAEEKKGRREDERKECERLALTKKDVRRKVQKYDRLQGFGKSTVSSRELPVIAFQSHCLAGCWRGTWVEGDVVAKESAGGSGSKDSCPHGATTE